MSVLEVLHPGMLTTVQDLGRPGYGALGVSACGTADSLAARLANLVLGNEASDAVLEMTLAGARVRFDTDTRFALAGADFGAKLDGASVTTYMVHTAHAGQELAMGGARTGARGYLAVAGGIATEPVLGSRSTHLASQLGGFEGRALRKGDVVPIGDAPSNAPVRRLRRSVLEQLRAPRATLRVVDSVQTRDFTAQDHATLTASEWRVGNDSNRMGVRLSGASIASPQAGTMTTEGAPLGAIQVTPSGAPVILFVDHQTTGGYPKIGCVIAADHWRVAQLRPGDTVRFERVSLDAAREALLEQERLLEPEIALL